jgi:hypothetical protein
MGRKQNPEQRRRELCDAAIELPAADGIKGLAHLKVDRRAGLAQVFALHQQRFIDLHREVVLRLSPPGTDPAAVTERSPCTEPVAPSQRAVMGSTHSANE